VRVILFDLDGTVIDSTEAIIDGFMYTFEKFNLPKPAADDVKKLIGLPLDVMFASLGVDEGRVWDFVDVYKSRYRVISKEKTVLLPNAREAVEMAFEFARLGIVTTKTALYSKELLEYFGIMKYFEVLIGREDVKHPKPHPEPVLKALKHMNANHETAWMVGDTCLDMISAAKAGVKGVAVEFEYESRENLKKCSKIIKRDVLEAVEFIKKS